MPKEYWECDRCGRFFDTQSSHNERHTVTTQVPNSLDFDNSTKYWLCQPCFQIVRIALKPIAQTEQGREQGDSNHHA